jgi:hyperosmotically inducible protein
MKIRLRASLTAILLSVFIATALPTPAIPLQKSKSQGEPKTQKQLVREVRHQLVMLPYYTVFDNLTYTVEGDKVILGGQVVQIRRRGSSENY